MNNNKKSFDKKWYSEEFLNELKRTAYAEAEGNLTYTAKYAPDAVSKYGIDPRMLGGPIGKMARKLRLVPDFVLNSIHLKITERSLDFQKGLRQDFLCKLSYKRRFNQKQAH